MKTTHDISSPLKKLAIAGFATVATISMNVAADAAPSHPGNDGPSSGQRDQRQEAKGEDGSHYGGRITADNGTAITITNRNKNSRTFSITSDTQIVVNGQNATIADLSLGMMARVESSDGETATTIQAGGGNNGGGNNDQSHDGCQGGQNGGQGSGQQGGGRRGQRSGRR